MPVRPNNQMDMGREYYYSMYSLQHRLFNDFSEVTNKTRFENLLKEGQISYPFLQVPFLKGKGVLHLRTQSI